MAVEVRKFVGSKFALSKCQSILDIGFFISLRLAMPTICRSANATAYLDFLVTGEPCSPYMKKEEVGLKSQLGHFQLIVAAPQ